MLSGVEQIKSKLSIVDVVGSYLKLEKAGVNMKARCPFHNEKSASFFVSPGRETYHCFGCAKGGDIFSFVEEIEHVEFREALAMLAERAGVKLDTRGDISSTTSRMRNIMADTVTFYENLLGKNPKAIEYLKNRGLTNETIKDFRIGYAPGDWSTLTDYQHKRGYRDAELEQVGLVVRGDRGVYDRFRGRIMFPFFDYSGRPIGFSGRIMPGVGDERMGKYVNSPETPLFHKSKVFYGIDKAKLEIRERDQVILVEGQLDLIMAHQAGTRNAVAVSGTAFTVEHVSILRRLSENLLIVLDSDEAGFRASERSLRTALAGGMYVSVVGLPTGEDPADVIKKSVDDWRQALMGAKSFTLYALDFIRTKYSGTKEIRDAVATYLYPHVKEMYNEIEKDKSIQAIAGILGASLEATRKDYEKWLESSMAPPKEESKVESPTSPTLVMVARRLLGIAAILEGKDRKDESEKIKKKVSEHIDLSNVDTADAAFEAEMYHANDKSLDEDIRDLEKRLEQESIRRQFSEAMDNLRKAELSGNHKEIEIFLKKCQELSKKLI